MLRAMRALLASALVATALAACTAPTSKQCREVCTRQNECEASALTEASGAAETGFDESECVAACAALERDQATVALVAAHVDCVHKAQTCPDVLACP